MISIIKIPLLLVLNPLLAQTASEYAQPMPSISPAMIVVWLAIFVLMVAAMWKVFTKAGHPGWASLIPIYNLYVLCLIAGRPGWWVILLLIPFVNFVIAIILCVDIAKGFGKGAGFGVGLFFLGIIFFPILAFGSAQYQMASGPPRTI